MINETVFIPIFWDCPIPYEKVSEPCIIGVASSKTNALSLISMHLYQMLQNFATRAKNNSYHRKDIVYLETVKQEKISEIVFETEDPSLFYPQFFMYVVSLAPEKDQKEMHDYLPVLFDIEHIEIKEVTLNEYAFTNFIHSIA